jgi:very-short-patch-repair endonuclease
LTSYASPTDCRSRPSLGADAGLEAPLANVRVAGYEVDFLWPQRRLVVETDGAAAHQRATAFEEDRRRDAVVQIAGFRVVRFTWRQVVHEAQRARATLQALASV